MNEQKETKGEVKIQKVGEALRTTVNALKTLKTGDPYDVTRGTSQIISSIATVAGGGGGGGGFWGAIFSIVQHCRGYRFIK